MVKDDGEVAKSKKTLETANQEKVPDGPSLPKTEDSQIEKDANIGARVSAAAGDDMSVTLAELSSKRSGRKGAHQLKDGGKDVTDGKMDSISGDVDDSVILRRSRRKKVATDSGDNIKKLKRIVDGEKGKEEKEERTPEDEDGEEEDDEEEESEFSVGDFVWGKVKSHPWWPGRVFNPSDASQQALKYKHEGRILVAYFGDATFAWCDESQLKPFVENFAEMTKQSNSKNFLNAVEEAVTEFAGLVELDMTCYCTPGIEQSAHDQGSALNAGIKVGVNVNKGGIGMYSVDRFNPAAFLDHLRVVGKHASVNTLLELMTLKSQVSAVYRSKDGPLMLKFNEMQEAGEYQEVEAGVEESIRGPVEESVLVYPGMPDSAVSAKRKERSVAEILHGGAEANNGGGGVVEGVKSVKTDSKSVRKKRKALDEIQKKDGDESLINQSGKRERKLKEISKGEAETGHGVNPEDGTKVGSRSSRMKVKENPKPMVVETNLVALEESEMTPRTRERKKSKYLSPPYTIIEYNRQMAVAKATEACNVSQSGQTSSKSASDETLKKNLPTEDFAEPGKPNGSVPGTPTRAFNRKLAGTKSIESSNVLSGIQSAARSGQLSKEDDVKGFLSSYRSSKYQNESSCNPSEADDQSGGKGEIENEEKKYLKKCKDRLKNKAKEVDSEKEVGNEGRKSSKKSETKHAKAKLKNKGKVVVESEKNGLDGNKDSKKSEAKDEKAKVKNKGKEVELEKEDNITGRPQSAALHLKFPADYKLPSKDDLVAMYGKFGALATSRTKISQESSSAKLVFLINSDAEAACKSSREINPFGEAKVSFRVRHLKATYEEKEVDGNGFVKESTNSDSQKRKRSSKKQSRASESDGGLRIVKQKLEGMSTMVAEAGDEKMSSEMKSNLESRLKDLLEEVKALP